MKKRIVFTGGGSGGHIYPLLAVIDELIEKNKKFNYDLELFYLGPKHPLNEEFLRRGIKIYHLSGGKIRRYFSLLNIFDIPKIIFSFIQAFFLLYFLMPDLIFSKGGPGALPVVIMARFYFIPVFIHESDTIPGLTNKISQYFAKKIFISFETTFNYFPKNKTFLVGNPIRRRIKNIIDKKIAKEMLGFDENKPLIFVLGGSQGAKILNDFVIENFQDLTKHFYILHQIGVNNYEEVKNVLKEENKNYKMLDFLQDYILNLAYNAADLVISRAGSGAIFEIAYFKKPSILIPLKNAANNHQMYNAYEYKKYNSTVIVEEENFKYSILISQINYILNNKELMKTIEKGAANFIDKKDNAGYLIADEIFINLKLI